MHQGVRCWGWSPSPSRPAWPGRSSCQGWTLPVFAWTKSLTPCTSPMISPVPAHTTRSNKLFLKVCWDCYTEKICDPRGHCLHVCVLGALVGHSTDLHDGCPLCTYCQPIGGILHITPRHQATIRALKGGSHLNKYCNVVFIQINNSP